MAEHFLPKVSYTVVKWFREHPKVLYSSARYFREHPKVFYSGVRCFRELRNHFTTVYDVFGNSRR